jgi:mannosyltransferase
MWRDEAVTADAARRPLGDLFRLLDHVDAVHGFYYFLMHWVIRLFGDSPVALRMPSVIAASVAAGGTAILGRRLGGTRLGLFAGLLVAVSPSLSRYAQECRQYTITTALAVVCTLLLVRALDRRQGFRWYGLSVAALGGVHLFALLLLPAHLVLMLSRRHTRHIWFSWSAAVLAGLAPCAVLARVAGPQSTQVGWITVPPDALTRLLDDFAGSPGFLAASLALILLGREPAVWRVAGPWLLIPPATLLIVSQWDPIFVYRYVLFSLPAMALLVAAGLDRFRWYLAWPSILVAGLLTLPLHEKVRDGSARPDDISTLASVIAEQKEPGDGLVFGHATYRRVEGPFPKAYAGLRDVFLRTDAWTAGNLDGIEYPPEEFRLNQVNRVFYVRTPGSTTVKEQLLPFGKKWTRIGLWLFKGGSVHLLQRRHPPF